MTANLVLDKVPNNEIIFCEQMKDKINFYQNNGLVISKNKFGDTLGERQLDYDEMHSLQTRIIHALNESKLFKKEYEEAQIGF